MPELFPLYYERKLLEFVKQSLVATKFGQKFSLPPNSGRTAVFTRFQPLPVSTTPLTGQPTPAVGASMTAQQVQATIEEYGNYIDLDEFTDITAFTPLVDAAVDILSYNAQQTLDKVAMEEITNGTNVLYAGGANNRDGLNGTKELTKVEIRNAVSLLKRANIPTFQDGFYVCLIHPDKLAGLFTDSELIALSGASREYLETGVVKYAGVKFIDTTALPIVQNSTNKDVYITVVIGFNAYGVVDIDGMTMRMEMTNLDKLGRVKTIGWKAYFACKRLYEPAIVRIESN